MKILSRKTRKDQPSGVGRPYRSEHRSAQIRAIRASRPVGNLSRNYFNHRTQRR